MTDPDDKSLPGSTGSPEYQTPPQKSRSKQTYKYLADLLSSQAANKKPSAQRFVHSAGQPQEVAKSSGNGKVVMLVAGILVLGGLAGGIISMQRSSQATALFDRASALAPKSAGKDEALHLLNHAEQLGLRDKKLYGLRASVESDLGQYQPAIDDYEKAIKLDSSNGAAEHTGRAECLLKLGKFDDAIAECNTLLKGTEGPSQALRIRAAAYEGAGKWHQAIDDCSYLLAHPEGSGSASDGNIMAIRGVSYAKLNFRDKALDDLNHAVDAGQKRVDVYVARARILQHMGKADKAVEDLNAALRLPGDKSEALKLRKEFVGADSEK